MSTSATSATQVSAVRITITDDALTFELNDGRTVSAPLSWYPRLLHATANERCHHRMIGDGRGVHWPDLDEDVSVENLLSGSRSGETQESLRKWLESRAAESSS